MKLQNLHRKALRLAQSARARIATANLLAFASFFVLSTNIAYAAAGAAVAVAAEGASLLSKIAGLVAKAVLIIAIPGALLWLSGNLFDYALLELLINFTNILGKGPGSILSAIKDVWTVIRDISNIMIIGIFVYIAIRKILGVAQNFNKLIVNMLSVAVLINFSFFFTQLVIDLSNWLSVEIYKVIVPETSTTTLSQLISGYAGIGSIFGSYTNMLAKIGQLATIIGGDPVGTILFILTTFITFVLLAIMFFRLTFMIVGRWIILVLLMATSSFAFAAMLIPSLQKYWKNWYEGLVYNAMLGPILLILLWVFSILAKAVSSVIKNTLGDANWFAALSSVADTAAILANSATSAAAGISNSAIGTSLTGTSFGGTGYWTNTFLSLLNVAIILGLLWAVIRIATTLSTQAAESAGGLGKGINNLLGKMQSFGMNKALRGGSLIGMHTLGAGFKSMESSMNTKAMQYQTGGKRGRAAMARMAANLAGKGAAANYDGRNIKGLKDQFSKAGMQLSAGGSGGIDKLLKDKDKAQAERDKTNDAANRDTFAKEIREAGIDRNQTEMEQDKQKFERQMTESETREKELNKTMSNMAEHNSKLNTKDGANIALQQTHDRVEQLKVARDKAITSNDSALVQQMESEIKQQEAKITAISTLISKEEAVEQTTNYKDAQKDYESRIERIDALSNTTMDPAKKAARKQSARTRLDARLQQIRDTQTLTERNSAKRAHGSISQTLIADNVRAQIAQTHTEQNEAGAGTAATERDLQTYNTIKDRANERSERLGLSSVGEKSAQSISTRMAIIQNSDELDKTIIDLRESIQHMSVDIKQALADGDTTKAATLQNSIDRMETYIQTTEKSREALQKTIISQRDTMESKLETLRIEKNTLERIRRSGTPLEKKGAESQLLKIRPFIIDLTETLATLEKYTQKSKKERRKTPEDLRNAAKESAKEGEEAKMFKELMKALKTAAKEKS